MSSQRGAQSVNDGRQHLRLPLLLAAATLTLWTVSGCGQEDPDTSGAVPSTAGASATSGIGSSEPKPPAKDVCALVTAAQASEIMGQAAAIDTEGKTAVAGRDCVWLGKNPSLHQLHLQLFQGKSFYSPAKWPGASESVTGLGDEAFLVRKGMLGTTVGFRVGDTVVFLNYQILMTRNPDPGAAADKMIALAQSIEGRL